MVTNVTNEIEIMTTGFNTNKTNINAVNTERTIINPFGCSKEYVKVWFRTLLESDGFDDEFTE